MRAGHNIHSGLETIANETADPLRMEFKKLMEELALGSQMEPALHGLGKRIPILDLKFFITSLILQRQTGANMVSVLENLAMLVRERLSMLFFRLMGVAGAEREAHARLFVNNEYAGLYTIVESPDKDFLERNFGEREGRLYNYQFDDAANLAGVPPFVFQYLGSDPSLYVPSPFKPETQEDDPQIRLRCHLRVESGLVGKRGEGDRIVKPKRLFEVRPR